jgi:hypothetical protein
MQSEKVRQRDGIPLLYCERGAGAIIGVIANGRNEVEAISAAAKKNLQKHAKKR